MTAQIGLFKRLALPPPPEDGSDAPSNGQVVVVNGAASSVGAFVVQLAKKAGYAVVGTAGSSAKVAQDLGAVVVDYRGKSDDELAQAIKEEVDKVGKLAGTYDAVSTDSTVDFLAKVVDGSGGGLITTVLPTRGEEKPDSIPSSVKVVRTMVGTAHSDDSEFAKKWYRIIGGWLDQGKFKANDVKVLPGGLDGVAEGMDLLEQGKVNGVKFVYRISETKSLQ
jgi:NADPH:quinone reductase-like Zn-dependent oxidoreductase